MRRMFAQTDIAALNISVVKFPRGRLLAMSEALEDPRLTVAGLLAETWTGFAARHHGPAGRARPRRGGVRGAAAAGRTPGGLLRMGDLAAQTSLTSSGITRLVDRLVAAGSVQRQACTTDRRTTYAVITNKGRASPGGSAARPPRPDRALARRPHPVRPARRLRRHPAHLARRGAPCAEAGAKPSAETEAVARIVSALCRRRADSAGA